MDYQILPIGDVWNEGMFSVPAVIASKYIRLASAYQLKALLIVLSNGGRSTSREIATKLGVPESEVRDLVSFWVSEGVLVENGSAPTDVKAEAKPSEKAAAKEEPKKEEPPKRTVEELKAPNLTPAAITEMLRSDKVLLALMHNAEEVLGRLLNHTEKVTIINMASYYGLPNEVALTILQYYKNEKENGSSIGMSYVSSMAKNWCEEGITTLDAAEEKLAELEESDKNWDKIIEWSEIRRRKPTKNQRDMIKRWRKDFSMEMIELACETMKEHAQNPSLKYVNSVLKTWKQKELKTPEDVAKDNEEFAAKKEAKPNGKKLQTKPSFDIDSIQNEILNNDNFDI